MARPLSSLAPSCPAPRMPTAAGYPDQHDRCDTACRCWWCGEVLETGTGDEFRDARLGCCRYVVDLVKAGTYDQSFVDGLWRDTDVAVPVDVARGAAQSHVHVERLRDLGYRRPRPPPPPDVDLTLALGTNPFDGDFGEPGDRVLRDEIVAARSMHECHTTMAHVIRKGERHRVMVERSKSELRQYRWCRKCTVAMALGEPR